MAAKSRLTPHFGSSLQTGGNLFLGGVALRNYTLVSNGSGAGAITFTSDVTEFTSFVYGGGGGGSASDTGFFDSGGNGGGGGGRGGAKFTRDASSDLSVTTMVGIAGNRGTVSSDNATAGGATNMTANSVTFINAGGGGRGGFPFIGSAGGGGATGSYNDIIDFTRSNEINNSGGANGAANSGTNGGDGGGVGGNVGGDPRRPTPTLPLTSGGVGGDSPDGIQAVGRPGSAPGGAGSGATLAGGSFNSMNGGAGSIGRIIITFIAADGATDASNPFMLTNFTLTPGALV